MRNERYAFATDVVSRGEKNWAQAEDQLAQEARLKYQSGEDHEDEDHDNGDDLYIMPMHGGICMSRKYITFGKDDLFCM